MTTNETTMDYRWVKEPRWLFTLSEWSIKFWYDLTPEQKDDIKYLHRASAMLRRIAENECNGHPSYQTKYRFKCNKCGDYQFSKFKGLIRGYTSTWAHHNGCENGVYIYDGDISGEWEDEEWTVRDERKEATLRKNIQAIANKHNWKVEFQGDPRGAVVKLQIDGHDRTDLICA